MVLNPATPGIVAASVIIAAFMTANTPLAASLWPMFALIYVEQRCYYPVFRLSKRMTYCSNKQGLLWTSRIIHSIGDGIDLDGISHWRACPVAFQVRCLVGIKVRPFVRGSYDSLLSLDTGMGYSHTLNFAVPAGTRC